MSEYDGFIYVGGDPSFHWHIVRGLSQPYVRELEIVREWVNKNPGRNNCYIDVGAHIGTTVLPYSRIFSNVVAFEANKENYQSLLTNIQKNDCRNVTCRNVGLSDRKFTAVPVKHGENSGCFYMKESSSTESVKMMVLDDEDIPYPVDFIKIDTEGSELHVLKGARKIIEKWKPLIQVETNKCSERYFGYGKEKIFSFLEDLGYTVMDDDGNDPFFVYDYSYK